MWVTVVFPFVPVTPTTFIPREGRPWKFAAATQAAALESRVFTKTASESRVLRGNSSASTAAAPFLTAASAYMCPSVVFPLTAMKRKPLRASFELSVIPRISVSPGSLDPVRVSTSKSLRTSLSSIYPA